MVSRQYIKGKWPEALIRSWAVYVADCAQHFVDRGKDLEEAIFQGFVKAACVKAMRGKQSVTTGKVNLVSYHHTFSHEKHQELTAPACSRSGETE